MFEIATIDQIRIILALAMLGIACASDIKKREIHDIIWVVFGAIAACLIPFSGNLEKELYTVGISLIIAPIAIIIWRVGLFGGADAFVLIVLAALAPSATLFDGVVSPFTVLTNAVLLSVTPMLVNVSRNLLLIATKKDIFNGFDETRSRKILAMIIGYRAANPKFGFSMERKLGEQKKLNLSFHHAENAAFCDEKDTWITPGIPYLMFIAAGFVLQLIYGDIMFRIFSVFT